MKINKTLCLDVDIVTSKEFQELVKQNQLSSLVNTFLRESLKIKDIVENASERDLRLKAQDLQTKLSTINAEIQKKEEERKKDEIKYPASQGWFKHPEYGWARRG